jgi:hypothetical protein
MTSGARARILLIGALCMTLLGACSSHKVRGVVVVGDTSYVTLVPKDDPRLEEGVPVVGATVSGVVDPSELNSTRTGAVLTDVVGAFALSIENFGAGLLEYELGVTARRAGYAPARGFFPLPGNDRRLLITLAPGVDREAPEASAFDDGYSWERDLERYTH